MNLLLGWDTVGLSGVVAYGQFVTTRIHTMTCVVCGKAVHKGVEPVVDESPGVEIRNMFCCERHRKDFLRLRSEGELASSDEVRYVFEDLDD